MAARLENPAADDETDENNRSVELKKLPYKRRRRFVCVEFPGVVKNIDNALITLGGVEKISKTYGDPAKRLELQWRPSDVYSKPVFGDRTSTSRLLIKVKRRWKRDDPARCEVTGEILGSIMTTYKYEALGDFQYLPMAREPNGTFTSLTKHLYINEPINIEEFMSRDTPMFLPPSSFSRFDKAGSYAFRPDIKHRPKYNDPTVTRPVHLIGTSRQKRPNYGHFLNHDIEAVPAAAHHAAVHRMRKLVDDDTISRLTKLFEERPLWTRPAILTEGEISEEVAKIILPALAFYWQTGPWRKCWCRFGYDPRQNPQAKLYQVIDFRLRQSGVSKHLNIMSKRSSMNPTLPFSAKVNKSSIPHVFTNASELSASVLKDGQTPVREKDLTVYVFHPDTKPPYRQVYYQVCDVRVDEVHETLRRNRGEVCDPQDGWYVKGTTQLCRKIMADCVEKLIVRPDSLSQDPLADDDNMDAQDYAADDGSDDEMEYDDVDQETCLDDSVSI